MLAYEQGLKGITIYRSGSREKEILQTGNEKKKSMAKKQVIKKPTPILARGIRIKKISDAGSVFTSVFFDEKNEPVETFVTVGKSGGYVSGASEATGRLASLALKYGASLEEVADELIGITCGHPVGFGAKAIVSLFDAVGKSLIEVVEGKQLDMFPTHKEGENKNTNPGKTKINGVLMKNNKKLTYLKKAFSTCPDCGSPMAAEEGCFKCTNPGCGYSKCS
jgi:ribonucleoside-diphosphate reductase alpha chain